MPIRGLELLFTPGIDQDIHAVFLHQIAQSDPSALHVVIMDQAGFYFRPQDPRLPPGIRLLPLPAYCPELNPAEWFGRLVKAPAVNLIYKGLRQLETISLPRPEDGAVPTKSACWFTTGCATK